MILNDDMEQVITLPSRGKVSKWTANDLKHTASREQQWIWILPRALYHIMDLKQNTMGTTGLGILIASALPIPDKTKDTQQTVHQGHPMV